MKVGYGSQDRVVAGRYTGTIDLDAYQRDNIVGGTQPANCANTATTSSGRAGSITLTVNVLKGCLLEGSKNIDFGRVGSIAAATTQLTASESVDVRCTPIRLITRSALMAVRTGRMARAR